RPGRRVQPAGDEVGEPGVVEPGPGDDDVAGRVEGDGVEPGVLGRRGDGLGAVAGGPEPGGERPGRGEPHSVGGDRPGVRPGGPAGADDGDVPGRVDGDGGGGVERPAEVQRDRAAVVERLVRGAVLVEPGDEDVAAAGPGRVPDDDDAAQRVGRLGVDRLEPAADADLAAGP